jgi:adenylate cyclase class 2
MYEVELKVRADHGAVREALADLGAERGDRVVQTDTYYDAPDRSFAATDEALRIRRERVEGEADQRVAVTYKGPKVDDTSKTREEHETTVGAPREAERIIEALGYDPVATVKKDRERYRVEGLTVTLDRVDGLGEFVEVETDVEAEREVSAARRRAQSLLSDLGLDPEEGIRTSYLGLSLGADE